MSWIAVGAGAVAVGGTVAGSMMSSSAAARSASQQKKLTKRFTKNMNSLQKQFEELNTGALEGFEALSASFDPYDLQNEFDSLYEAVIQPMETSFRENTLPAIRSNYSGGALGSAMFSGGREFSEAQARADLDMNKAMLRFQGRETGIQRNFLDYDRRRGDLGLQYEIGKEPIQSAMSVQRDIYGAEGDTILAQGAAAQARAQGVRDITGSISTAMGGFGGGTPSPTAGGNPFTTAMGPAVTPTPRTRNQNPIPVG